jgi:hypothetical protein
MSTQEETDNGLATRSPVSPTVRLEITPSATQYDQLCRDLGALRRAGAPTNTAAVLSAVRVAASAKLNDS